MEESKTDSLRFYQTDPSGTLNQWNAVVIGKGGEDATKNLEEEWEEGMEEDEAIELAVESLKEGEDDLENANVEVAVVSVEDGYQRIEPDELEERGLGV